MAILRVKLLFNSLKQQQHLFSRLCRNLNKIVFLMNSKVVLCLCEVQRSSASFSNSVHFKQCTIQQQCIMLLNWAIWQYPLIETFRCKAVFLTDFIKTHSCLDSSSCIHICGTMKYTHKWLGLLYSSACKKNANVRIMPNHRIGKYIT